MNPDEAREELARLVSAARRHVELEASYGADRISVDPANVKRHREEIMAKRKAHAAAASSASFPSAPAKTPEALREKAAALEAIRAELQKCCLCGLGKGRTNLVFGDGAADADLMFIGEAPGESEDLQGIPFVGRAGQLLTDIISAIGFTRQEVYIANICKCRPPNNRLPLPEEVQACLPFLMRQIEIIRPAVIVTLGNLATQTLLQTETGITKLRGRFVQWNGAFLMPTYHPSYLLRNPSAKREVWIDMKAVHARMSELGLKVGELKQVKRPAMSE